ncbi:MAG: arylsulfatase [Pirellulaceae bacterium]
MNFAFSRVSAPAGNARYRGLRTRLVFRRLLLIAVLLGWGTTASEVLAEVPQRPNVLIVLADDMGYGDVGAYNPDAKIPTPHIDRLAGEGMKFTDAHTSSGVCTPTRYSLLTGRYHWRTRLQSGVLGGFSPPLIEEDRLTLGGLFQQAGYHTACVGKWHLGMSWPLKGGQTANDRGNFSQPFDDLSNVDYTSPIQAGPVDRGFDHFYGISASLDMYPYVWIDDRLPTEVASVTKAFHRPGPAGEDFEAIDVQEGIIDHTIQYIGQRVQEDKPFFAYVPLAAPHTPIVPTPKWQGKSGINPYADFVMQIDADMGRLLEALETQGVAENTIVVFTTDNGCSPQAKFPELHAAGHQPSYIYRGHKADLYEGGHRVPLIVRWPGQVKAGSESDQLIGQTDFMATFAEMLGAKLEPTQGEDSVSFLPVLRATAEKPIRESIISQSINGSFAIRDGQWKLALCPGSGGWSFPRPGKETHADLPDFQLYNLADDPSEETNLVEQHPERVANMKAAMEAAIAQGRTTPGPQQKNAVDVKLIKPIPRPLREKEAR